MSLPTLLIIILLILLMSGGGYAYHAGWGGYPHFSQGIALVAVVLIVLLLVGVF